MQNLSEANITDAVVETFANTPDARLQEIMTALVKHLHAFVREVNLTEAEWLAGIQFLTATGQMCDERRQEFILLSDTLGVSTLKDLINNHKPEGLTEWSVLGPFYRSGAEEMHAGADIAGNISGEPVILSGRVLAPDGRPIANALLDVWQSDSEGHYDLQLVGVNEMLLRGRFRTNEKGEYAFRTIRPSFYPVPDDGPVGKMLKAVRRHPYRPAHIHFQLSAEGYKLLTTELYLNGDPYLDSDVVFGVRSSLIIDLEKRDGVSAAQYDFVLEPR